jgi:hypothetical protein
MLRRVTSALKAWTANPKVSTALLSEALGEVLTLEKSRPPVSTAYKVEYIKAIDYLTQADELVYLSRRGLGRRGLEEPSFTDMAIPRAVRWFLRNEKERNRRIIQLLFADWMAECDKPWTERAASAGPFRIYHDPDDSIAVHSLSAEELAQLVAEEPFASDLARTLPRLESLVLQESTEWATLIVMLAEQLHLRDNGFVPARPEELVGRYLKALPDGFDFDLSRIGPRPILPEISPVYSRVDPGMDLLRPRVHKMLP